MAIVVGSKVRCVDKGSSSLLVVGQEYQVAKIDPFSGYLYLVGVGNGFTTWRPDRFVLVSSSSAAAPAPSAPTTAPSVLVCSICGKDSDDIISTGGYTKSWKVLGSCAMCRDKAGYTLCRCCSNYTVHPQDRACLYCSDPTTAYHNDYIRKGGKLAGSHRGLPGVSIDDLLGLPGITIDLPKAKVDIDEEKCWERLKPRIDPGYCKCGILSSACSYHRVEPAPYRHIKI